MKIVINTCFGGFGLSHEAVLRYAEIKGIKLFVEDSGYSTWKYNYYTKPLQDRASESDGYFSEYDIERTDPALVQVVEEMGAKASGRLSKLKVVEVPDGVKWEISEYDGLEHIAEQHQTWS